MSQSFSEQAGEVENDEAIDEIARVTKEELTQIDSALQRVDASTFGTCTACGETISAERLAIIPMAELCKNCA